MATILLQAAGAALGSIFGPIGAAIGQAAGAMAGNMIDQAVISSMTTLEGSKLSTARISGGQEGAPVTRLYGTARIGGTIIWATRFEEQATIERTGAKGGGPRQETFSYFANVAFGLCEGPISAVRRIWADGQELDQQGLEIRVHRGSAGQDVDPLIEAKQGQGNAPAYRGMAYVVFEGLPLEAFGNRIPVLEFEVLRAVGTLEEKIKAVTMIPGATEHGYDPVQVTERIDEGEARIINRNQFRARTDLVASVDELLDLCPHLERVALVTAWFGTDLRVDHCQILPGVETLVRSQESIVWSVGGVDRASAHLVSRHDGGPAYGGTPSDHSIIGAIRHLKNRGIEVYLYPFIMMDVPDQNGLPDPRGANEQPAYPWRGRITCHPAPGRPGSPDQSATINSAVAQFLGNAKASDFSIQGDVVTYNGNSKGYRRMILHHAHLAQVAGDVDGFIIGSECVGLTTLRGAGGTYPFVDGLVALAADVASVLGTGTRLTYAADWSEYFGHHPADAPGDAIFHLDPLWASPHIKAVGIDNYMPLADWRDIDHIQAHPDGARLADDSDAMRAAITSGEGFDYYYASASDRQNRIRTPIQDGAYGEDWIWRPKDLAGWWKNQHFNRIKGTRSTSPTAWQPGMKPIWFTETGCPAIDRGGNQPNVFVDPASSESSRPYFSGGNRSDNAQRRFLDALLSYWSGDSAPDGMVDPDRIFIWTWDARPCPTFPEELDVYADGNNWRTGHWLNNRLGGGTLRDVFSSILTEHGFRRFNVDCVAGDLKGYVVASPGSARQALEPLMAAFMVDGRMVNGRLHLVSRGAVSAPSLALEVLADVEGEPLFSERRSHDSDLAAAVIVDHASESDDYEELSVRSRRIVAGSDRIMRLSLPAVLAEGEAHKLAENLLRDSRLQVRNIHFNVAPNMVALEPGDVISLPGRLEGRFRITRIEDGKVRRIDAVEASEGNLGQEGQIGRKKRRRKHASRAFAPLIRLFDLPPVLSLPPEAHAIVAIAGKPWKSVAVSVGSAGGSQRRRAIISRPATLGSLRADLAPGPRHCLDLVSSVAITLTSGAVSSVDLDAMLAGDNRLYIQSPDGTPEIIGFTDATETAPGQWQISGLLRGLAGTSDGALAGAPAGSKVLVLDSAVTPLGLLAGEAGQTVTVRLSTQGLTPERFGPYDFVGGLRADTPFAPVHLEAVRQSDGTIRISFIRCGRIDSDDWEAVEIPLDEPWEAYRLDILHQGQTKRSVDLAQPLHIYPLDQQIADFGAAPLSLSFRVSQKGRKIAFGIPADTTVKL